MQDSSLPSVSFHLPRSPTLSLAQQFGRARSAALVPRLYRPASFAPLIRRIHLKSDFDPFD